jgi:hypothetical protein
MIASMDSAGLSALDPLVLWGAILESLYLLGVFPLTQVYQHEEDGRRGDLTISRLLGTRGTFVLSAVFLGLATAGLALWLALNASPAWAAAFLASQAPTLAYFARWALRSFRDPAAADFKSTMIMNGLAAGALNLFFAAFLALR